MKKTFKIILILGVFAALGIWFFGFRGNNGPVYEYVLVEKRDVVKSVSVTGRVKPGVSADLAFEQAGKINALFVKIGDTVFSGSIIASVDNSDVKARLAQAQAGVKAEEAKLNALSRGARDEEIKVQEAKVENKKILLAEAEQNLANTISDSYTKADDAIRNKVDQFISNPKSSNPELTFQLADQSGKNKIEEDRVFLEILFAEWNKSIFGTDLTDNIESFTFLTKENLGRIKNFLDEVSLAINGLTPNASLSQTVIDGYKSDISTARTTINTAVSNLSSAEEKLNNALTSFSLEKEQLNLILAGSSDEDISAQQATLEKAQALSAQYEAELSKSFLRSPFSGVVSKIDVEVGETVSFGESVATVISLNKFKVEANVPEVDIAEIKKGNIALITLDAYGDEVIFEASVVFTDPAETIIEGVPTYKTTLVFNQDDERVKSGMTANLEIKTDERKDVIVAPLRAVFQDEGKSLVRILNDIGEAETTEVKIGLIGSDGFVEIMEGISDGDKVIIFEKE